MVQVSGRPRRHKLSIHDDGFVDPDRAGGAEIVADRSRRGDSAPSHDVGGDEKAPAVANRADYGAAVHGAPDEPHGGIVNAQPIRCPPARDENDRGTIASWVHERGVGSCRHPVLPGVRCAFFRSDEESVQAMLEKSVVWHPQLQLFIAVLDEKQRARHGDHLSATLVSRPSQRNLRKAVPLETRGASVDLTWPFEVAWCDKRCLLQVHWVCGR